MLTTPNIIQDEGVQQGAVNTLNFVGAGVSAAVSGAVATITVSGGGGGGANTGTAILNFGAFPGSSDTSVAVTGQAGIVSGSIVEAWIRPVDTADHSADEHMVETIKVFAGNISAGVGFTIYGFDTNQLAEPIMPARLGRFLGAGQDVGAGQQDRQVQNKGGTFPRPYGQFTVAWSWT